MSRHAAFISDVHGNLTAIKAVLADICKRGIDEVYFLGDVLGKGPAVHEAIELLRNTCTAAVYGNWDRLVLYGKNTDRFGAYYYKQRLTDEDVQYIADLPEVLRIDFEGRRVVAYHGRPSIARTIYPAADSIMDDYAQALNHFLPSDVVIMGDAHHPFMLTRQGRFLMNTGAVGNPCDGVVQASYLILHDVDGAFSSEHVHVPYDVAHEVGRALRTPQLPMLGTYIGEIATARYMRDYSK